MNNAITSKYICRAMSFQPGHCWDIQCRETCNVQAPVIKESSHSHSLLLSTRQDILPVTNCIPAWQNNHIRHSHSIQLNRHNNISNRRKKIVRPGREKETLVPLQLNNMRAQGRFPRCTHGFLCSYFILVLKTSAVHDASSPYAYAVHIQLRKQVLLAAVALLSWDFQ